MQKIYILKDISEYSRRINSTCSASAMRGLGSCVMSSLPETESINDTGGERWGLFIERLNMGRVES